MTEQTDYKRLDRNDAALLLVDHQSGLISLVQDFSPGEFKNNVLALAATGAYFELPTVLTTSFEDGPNGPLVPELKETYPDAPYIARPGNINAWDNEDFLEAVRATGKKQLIIAGVVTEVCVAFPALSAIEEGYEVFVVTDASGTFNEVTRHSAWLRMQRAASRLAQRHRGDRRAVLQPHPQLSQPDDELLREARLRQLRYRPTSGGAVGRHPHCLRGLAGQTVPESSRSRP